MSMQMLKSLHRRAIGLTNDNQVLGQMGFVAGGDGKPAIVLPGAPDTVAIFDDFLGDAVNTAWVQGVSDTGQATTVPLGVAGGVARMLSSATSVQTPVGGAQQLGTGAQFKANAGRLRMSARLKIATLLGNNVFVGFSDTGGAEIAVYDTGGGIITPAGDYAGFLKAGGAAATNLTWRAVAGKAGADQVAAPSPARTPVANVYDVLEVAVDANGHASFFINGAPVAQIQNALTPTVAMAGGVWRANTEGAADAVDVDYLNVSGARDTGE